MPRFQGDMESGDVADHGTTATEIMEAQLAYEARQRAQRSSAPAAQPSRKPQRQRRPSRQRRPPQQTAQQQPATPTEPPPGASAPPGQPEGADLDQQHGFWATAFDDLLEAGALAVYAAAVAAVAWMAWDQFGRGV